MCVCVCVCVCVCAYHCVQLLYAYVTQHRTIILTIFPVPLDSHHCSDEGEGTTISTGKDIPKGLGGARPLNASDVKRKAAIHDYIKENKAAGVVLTKY